jgi:hypothetical protein
LDECFEIKYNFHAAGAHSFTEFHTILQILFFLGELIGSERALNIYRGFGLRIMLPAFTRPGQINRRPSAFLRQIDVKHLLIAVIFAQISIP